MRALVRSASVSICSVCLSKRRHFRFLWNENKIAAIVDIFKFQILCRTVYYVAYYCSPSIFSNSLSNKSEAVCFFWHIFSSSVFAIICDMFRMVYDSYPWMVQAHVHIVLDAIYAWWSSKICVPFCATGFETNFVIVWSYAAIRKRNAVSNATHAIKKSRKSQLYSFKCTALFLLFVYNCHLKPIARSSIPFFFLSSFLPCSPCGEPTMSIKWHCIEQQIIGY